ncbi:MAG: type IV pilin protein [Candidatus Dependentiae bacterium]
MNKKSGFSLIELMIVVAIMAFLAMVSMPSFTRYLAKAKRAEAYMQLHALYAAQKAYWAEHGTYTTSLQGPDSAGWCPEGYCGGGSQERFYYTYGFGGSEGVNHFTGKLEASAAHLGKAHADNKSFLVLAAADIDGDGELDILSIDHHGTIKIERDDLA